MAKKAIHLTENELKQMIYEEVKEAFGKSKNHEIIDISKIDINILKSAYHDLRLTPTITVYGDILSNLPSINEGVGDILPPDTVVKNLIKKYGLPPQLVLKREAFNKIYIYVITALIGENDKLIEQDMQKMGYFLGYRQPPQTINGMVYQVLQFEPTSQMQNDETEIIKSNYDFLFHWTPMYCLGSVMNNGLIPNHKNKMFSYPSRIYLMKGNSKMTQMINLGQQLCFANNNISNNGEYSLLRIDIEDIDDNIRFYYDSNSEIGVYTEQKIPKDRIEFIGTHKFKTRTI